MPDNKENLFKEFPEVHASEWKAQIEKDLKGREFDTLRWKPYEGFTVEPFYTLNDLEALSYLTDESPGEFPYARGGSKELNEWDVCEHICEPSTREANQAALEAIRMGAQSITFICGGSKDNTKGVLVENVEHMSSLLKDISIDEIEINFKCGSKAQLLLELLGKEALKRNIDPGLVRGSVDTDPHRDLILMGTGEIAYDELVSLLSELSVKLPAYKGLAVSGYIFGDSGATIVQELAFTLASGLEYMDNLNSLGLEPVRAAGQMRFTFSIGSNYFMEIAKLRAARLLWAVIADQFGAGESSVMDIRTVSSNWNLTAYDPYTNMLRGTVSSMAASIGGSSGVYVAPLDSAYAQPSEFTRRMARNTQLLLKHESYIDRVGDPSAGSYYIESLTDKVAHAAWELFLEVDQSGGLIESFKSGLIQSRIEESRKSKSQDIETGRLAILGTNRYPNLTEKSQEAAIGKCQEPQGNNNHETPLRPYRASEPFERLRMATESYGGGKSVFLLPLGNPAMRTARAGFSANFFGCGGFDIIDKGAFDNIVEGVKAAKDSGAKIVVICSSDKEYPELVPGICEELKPSSSDMMIVVAGNPKEHIEELKSSGVDDFIHVRSNILQTLRKYQKAVGIE